jgi:tetratricopeptide (TPR) repeat protein
MKASKATVKSRPQHSQPGKRAVPAASQGVQSANRTQQQGIARKTLIIAACSVAVVALLAFINCLANGWVFDDYLHVLDPPELRSLSNVFRILGRYRPLRDISYAFDFRVWGESATAFHLTNIAMHSANTVLVFLLCYRLLGELPGTVRREQRKLKLELRTVDVMAAAVLASLIFALHPIQTDSVAYVSGRRDVLFSLFYLAAFHLYLSYCRGGSWKTLWLGLACWALSLMSKEMAASFPLVIFLWNYTGEWEHTAGKWSRRLLVSARTVLKRDGWLYLGMTVVVAAYSYYDIVTLRASERAGPGGFKYWGGGIYPNLLTELRVQAWFLKQLVFPTPIGQYSGAFPISTSIMDWKVVGSAALVLTVVGAGVVALGRWRLVSFAILSYFAMLLPVSQIVPHHELLADHYLYLPIVSLALLVGLGVKALAGANERRMALVYGVAALVLLALGVLTVRQNAVWKDDRSFWEANYAKVPDSPRAVYSLAVQYRGINPRKAHELFLRCLDLDPTYGQAYLGLASMANNKDDAQELESLIQSGLDIPGDRIQAGRSVTADQFKSQLETALAIVKGNMGDPGTAESLLWDAVSADPTNPQPYDLLGKVFAKDKSKQAEVLTKELAAIPDSIPAREGLVFLLIKDQRYDEAIPHLNAILAINPNDVFANYQMGQIYRTRKDCVRARAYMKTAASEASRSSDINDVKDAMKQLVRDCGAE